MNNTEKTIELHIIDNKIWRILSIFLYITISLLFLPLIKLFPQMPWAAMVAPAIFVIVEIFQYKYCKSKKTRFVYTGDSCIIITYFDGSTKHINFEDIKSVKIKGKYYGRGTETAILIEQEFEVTEIICTRVDSVCSIYNAIKDSLPVYLEVNELYKKTLIIQRQSLTLNFIIMTVFALIFLYIAVRVNFGILLLSH